VGIGTDAPGHLLAVAGNIEALGIGTYDGQTFVVLTDGRASLRLMPTAEDFAPNIIGGYEGNSVEGEGVEGATISGGGHRTRENAVEGDFGTVGGGAGNVAGGMYATVPGGQENVAEGNFSLAAGRYAQALHNGSFVWADSTTASQESFGDHTFTVRASGGTRIYSDSTSSVGVELEAGTSQWKVVSDRNLKENLEPVDPRSALERLSRVPVWTYNFIGADDCQRQMGPMAQDFFSAFGLGSSDTRIGMVDVVGATIAAVQGVNEVLAEKQVVIEDLQRDNTDQARRIAELERRLAALEGMLRSSSADAPR
jgi:hypothetical protein